MIYAMWENQMRLYDHRGYRSFLRQIARLDLPHGIYHFYSISSVITGRNIFFSYGWRVSRPPLLCSGLTPF